MVTPPRRKFAYPPNLVVIDGGPAQVAAAAGALDELGIDDVSVCGLAKRLEEVWLPGEDGPVIMPRTSEGLYLLQRVRDEAHRFAITYHRKKRSAALTASELDAVPGLGPARRATLLRHFGSVRRIAGASVAEIAGLPGIGPRDRRDGTRRARPCARAEPAGEHSHRATTAGGPARGWPGQGSGRPRMSMRDSPADERGRPRTS